MSKVIVKIFREEIMIPENNEHVRLRNTGAPPIVGRIDHHSTCCIFKVEVKDTQHPTNVRDAIQSSKVSQAQLKLVKETPLVKQADACHRPILRDSGNVSSFS
jgi:hypothetical protein